MTPVNRPLAQSLHLKTISNFALPRILRGLSVILSGLFTVTVMAQTPQKAQACQAQSSAQIVPLLELYTSEGCSSCPPADRWLSQTVLPQKEPINVLAWHVDYWDRLGWKDRFAMPTFTERQRRQGQFGRLATIYTPQFTLNGQDKPRWHSEGLARMLPQSPKTATAQIELSIDRQTQTARVSANGPQAAQWYLALYQDNLSSIVKAGENSGETLHHDRVVRGLYGPYALTAQQQLNLKPPSDFDWRASGAVVFVQSGGEILQSLTLPFKSCRS